MTTSTPSLRIDTNPNGTDPSQHLDNQPHSPSITPCMGQIHELDPTEYFSTTPCPPCVQPAIDQLIPFLSRHSQLNRPIVLVTSGGTTVPLEKNTIRYLDNFSAGTRGAVSAEHFLRNGYAVIFMHRQYSLRPFSRHYTHTRESIFDLLTLTSDGTVLVQPDVQPKAAKILSEYHRYVTQDQALLSIEFNTVRDYLFLLKACVPLIQNSSGSRALYYLAAAVSDFFIPLDKMVEHKIQSRGGILSLTLDPVPKTLRTFVNEWAPSGFTVSFKLETDPAMLEYKSKQALERYGHQLVIGNMLNTRKIIVYLYSLDKSSHCLHCDTISLSKNDQDCFVDIESYLILHLVKLHQQWMKNH